MKEIELSLEQQFNVRSFETQVEMMSLEQAQMFLKDLYRQMIVKEKMYQELLKKEWNLESNPLINKKDGV
jgi:predicted HD phosphohydrolase